MSLKLPLQRSRPRLRQPRVAVLVDTSTTWGRRIVTGINNYTRRMRQWQLLVEARGLEERIQVPRGWHGEGIIARVGNEAMAQDLRRKRLPVVNVSGIELPGLRMPRVTTDMQVTGELATQHFLDRGFRHFAYFSLRGLSYVAAQRDAFIQAVEQAGCQCAVFDVKPHGGAEPDWNLDLKKLGNWLKGLPKPVGILTWNADSGRQVVYACEYAGLKMPEEVALLSGTDDDLLCEVSHIPISAVLVAAEQIGFEAAAILDRIMRGGSAPARPKFIPPVGIVTRQSTDTLAIQDPALLHAIGFIRENAARLIQVNDAAQAAGLSRRVLERRFLSVLGRTPAEEIRRVHLERAKKMLVETDLPIPEVAEASGFGSNGYLSQVFKSEMGETPLKYRKKIRSR